MNKILKDLTFVNIGSFKLESENLIVCDPCLDEPLIKFKSLPGIWFANAFVSKRLTGEVNVEDIVLLNSEYSSLMFDDSLDGDKKTIHTVSELIGIYDKNNFKTNSEKWFIEQSLATNNEYKVGLLPYGVSCSVKSNVQYPIYVSSFNDYTVGIKLEFIEKL